MQGKKRTVGIIGIGHIGTHVAYSLAVQDIADEIILVDRERKKAGCRLSLHRDRGDADRGDAGGFRGEPRQGRSCLH